MTEKKKAAPAAFTLVEVRRAWWPVTFAVATEEGEVVDQRFEMRFIVHGQDEFLELMEEGFAIARTASQTANGAAGEAAENASPPTFSALTGDLVMKLASDWRGVNAENGEPLKWEEETLRKVLNVPNVFAAVMDAYKSCRAAKKELREGN